MKLILVRHAESADNVCGVLTGQGGNPDLSDAGILQCGELKKALANLSFDLFLTSPSNRTKKTALLSGVRSEILEEHQLVREKSFGTFEGRPVKEYEESIKSLSMQDLYSYRPANGESFHDLVERASNFITFLRDYNSKNVLLFSHECFNRCLIATVKKIPFKDWLSIPQANASFTEIHF